MVTKFSANKSLWIVLFFTGCTPDFGATEESLNLTQKEYLEISNNSVFDLREAKNISYKFVSTRDGYDIWIKATINSNDELNQIISRNQLQLQAEGYTMHFADMQKKDKENTGLFLLPTHWPKQPKDLPTWWRIPKLKNNKKFIAWDKQIDGSPYSARAAGVYLLFNPVTKSIWIWRWNYQHFILNK